LKVISDKNDLVSLIRAGYGIENTVIKDLEISGQFIEVVSEVNVYNNVIFSNCSFSGRGFSYIPLVKFRAFGKIEFLNCEFVDCFLETNNPSSTYGYLSDRIDYSVSFKSCYIGESIELYGIKNKVSILDTEIAHILRAHGLHRSNTLLTFIGSNINSFHVMDGATIKSDTFTFVGCNITNFRFLGYSPDFRDLPKGCASLKSLFTGQIQDMYLTGDISGCNLSDVSFEGIIMNDTLLVIDNCEVYNLNIRGMRHSTLTAFRVVFKDCIGLETVKYPEGTRIDKGAEFTSYWLPKKYKES